jgi:hypothetical protein
MRYGLFVLLLTVFLFSGLGVDSIRGQTVEPVSEKRTLVALDLMDLEIPGEEAGDEMALPPIQSSDRPDPEPALPADSPKPPEAGNIPSDFPPVSRSAPSSPPGLAPFLLEEPGLRGGQPPSEIEPSPEASPATLSDEFPAELKAVPPPPSRAERLKLPTDMDSRAPERGDAPEIPLLEGEGVGQQAPLGQDSSLTMKPLPDLRGSTGAGFSATPSRSGRRPRDTLQVSEDIDARLIDLYEKYYKDR